MNFRSFHCCYEWTWRKSYPWKWFDLFILNFIISLEIFLFFQKKKTKNKKQKALAVQSDKPFRGLEIFGTGFLSKFQSSELPSPLLESMILIDTPGVLSGEKQRLGRQYIFIQNLLFLFFSFLFFFSLFKILCQ